MEENKDGAFSPKALVDNYIKLKAEADSEYAAKIADLTNKSSKAILGACPIHIGDVFIKQRKSPFGKYKDVYYKVTNLKTDISGIVSVYGTKRKQDKSWSKREGVYMFTTSIYNNFEVDKDFTYISDYNNNEHAD